MMPIAIIIFIVVVLFSVVKRFMSGDRPMRFTKKGDNRNIAMNVGERQAIDEVTYVPDNFDTSQLKPMNTIAKAMPDFDAEKLNEHISNLYVRMQNA